MQAASRRRREQARSARVYRDFAARPHPDMDASHAVATVAAPFPRQPLTPSDDRARTSLLELPADQNEVQPTFTSSGRAVLSASAHEVTRPVDFPAATSAF